MARRPTRLLGTAFISLEKHPFPAADLALAQAAWPEFAVLAEQLRQRWPALQPGVQRIEFEGARLILTLVFGDAVDTLPKLATAVDAFYLDGYSPARNPELWSPALCRSLARVAVSGATLATWTVAGSVRKALTSARFDVKKRPGFAGKRQMLAARYGQRDFAAAP